MAGGESFCPKCGTTIPPGHAFCYKCGAPRYEPGAAVSDQGPVHRVRMGVPRPPPPPPSPPPAAPPQPGWTAPPTTIPSPEARTTVCGNCGATVDAESGKCWKCGSEFEPEATSAQASWSPPGSHPELIAFAAKERARRRSASPHRSVIGGTLFLIGVVMLIVTLFVGWYAATATATTTSGSGSTSVTGTETFYPLNQVMASFSCSGQSCNGTLSTTDSYSQAGIHDVGNLYTIVVVFVSAGIALTLAAAVFALTSAGRRSGWALLLAVIGIVLVAAAPTILLGAQPSLLKSDEGGSGGAASGNATASPASSFFGSCSGSGCGGTLANGQSASGSWGPSWGWYLCLAALAPLVTGFLLVRSQKRAPPSPEVAAGLPR